MKTDIFTQPLYKKVPLSKDNSYIMLSRCKILQKQEVGKIINGIISIVQ